MLVAVNRQTDFVALVFGLGLFSLATLCFCLRGRDQRLPWLWLGLFALVRGVDSWLGLAVSDAQGPPWQIVHSGLIAVSCLFLTEVWRAGLAALDRRGPGRWIHLFLVLILGVAAGRGPDAVRLASDAGVLPASALLSAWVVWRVALGASTQGRWLRLGAAAFAVFGISTLLMQSLPAVGAWTAPDASIVLLLYTGLVIAGALAVAVYWGRNWSAQRGRHYIRGRGAVTLGLGLAVLGSLVGGWLLTEQSGRTEEDHVRRDLLTCTLSAAATLDPDAVQTLVSAPDAGQAIKYQALRAALFDLRRANPDCRFAYLMTLRRGKVVFCADAEPTSSPAFSPPGQSYPEASTALRALFAGAPALVEGPLTDRWGEWLSGLAPIADPRTRRIIAVLGMDISAERLTQAVARARLSGLAVTAGVLVLVISLFISFQRFADFAARLDDSERSYRALVESSPNAIIVADPSGSIVSANRYAQQTLGRVHPLCPGAPFTESFCPHVEPLARQAFDAVVAGRPAQFEAECRLAEHDYAAWQVGLSPILDENGGLQRFVAIAVDVTERKRSERDAREALRRLTAVDEIARAVASTLDQDSVMRIVVREVRRVVGGAGVALIMCEPGGHLGRIVGVDGALATDPVAGTGAQVDLHRMGLEEAAREGRCLYLPDLALDPQPVAQRLCALGIRSSVILPLLCDGLLTGGLCVARRGVDDFSAQDRALLESLAPHLAAAIKNAQAYDQLRTARAELQRAQEQMIRTERLRSVGEVAGGVAHDFNNLLGVILSRVQVLLQQCPQPETRNSLQAIEKAARDGRDTVRRIQQFVGRRSGEALVIADLDEIVRGALQFTAYRWRDQAEREELPLEMHVELGAAPLVRVNPVEIREVAVNLILNACDALPHGGFLTVRTGIAEGWARLQVTDNGVGMDEATLAQAFELFYSTKGEGNAGLGLAVSEGIVQRHGGRIEVDSAPGQGTSFTVSLPLVAEPPAQEEVRMPQTPPGDLLRVLVVDDDPAVLSAMQEAIDALGYCALGVASGAAALDLVRQQYFDVVVTDLGMPGMSGWQVAEEVKRLSPSTQVMILTGWGDTIEPTRYVDETLTKPVELSVLREAMARAGQRRVP